MSKITNADFTQAICTHTIGVQSSKPSHAYPIIRLPREFRELAGSKAEIYQTTHEGKLAFMVTVDKKVDNCCLQTPEIDTESRFSNLETRIQSLEDTLIANNEIFGSKNEKDKKIKGRGRDSNPRRGLHRAIGLPGYPTSASLIYDSPVRIRTAVAGFLLSVANIQDHVNPKARMIDHYTTGLRPRVRALHT